MSMVAPKLLTAEEYFTLSDPSDGVRRELVRGEVVTMSNPGVEHGEVQLQIGFLLKLFLRDNPVGRAVTESGAITERDPDTVRGPDLSFYSVARLPFGKRVVKYHDQPPDLCVEVVSPTNTRRQLDEKIKEYFFIGVRVVWIVDPEERSVAVFTEPMEGKLLKGDKLLDGGDVLPGFSCRVADLFA